LFPESSHLGDGTSIVCPLISSVVTKRTTSGVRNVRLKEATQEPCQPYNLSDRPRSSLSAGHSRICRVELPVSCLKTRQLRSRLLCFLGRNNDVISNVGHPRLRRSRTSLWPDRQALLSPETRATIKLPNYHRIVRQDSDREGPPYHSGDGHGCTFAVETASNGAGRRRSDDSTTRLPNEILRCYIIRRMLHGDCDLSLDRRIAK
jgi:hypothetical protein